MTETSIEEEKSFVLSGPDDYLELIAFLASSRSPNQVRLFVSRNTPKIEELESAFRANTTVVALRLEADEAAQLVPMLQRLPSLQPLKTLELRFRMGSCTPLAEGIPYILNQPQDAVQKIVFLEICFSYFKEDFATGWTALQNSQTLEKVCFECCSFDRSNTACFMDCFKNMKKLDVTLFVKFCGFANKSTVEVAGDIYLNSKLKLVGFTCSQDDDYEEMMQTLQDKDKARVSLPGLSLLSCNMACIRVLCNTLPELTNVRELSVTRHLYVDSVADLQAAIKHNGSLHSVQFENQDLDESTKAYTERNRLVPELLAAARGDARLKLVVPTLLNSIFQSSRRLALTRTAAALKSWEGVGPSEETSAAQLQAAVAAALAILTQSLAAAAVALDTARATRAATRAAVNVATQRAIDAEAAIVPKRAAYEVALNEWKRSGSSASAADDSQAAPLVATTTAFAAAAAAWNAASAERAKAIHAADLAEQQVAAAESTVHEAAAAIDAYSMPGKKRKAQALFANDAKSAKKSRTNMGAGEDKSLPE